MKKLFPAVPVIVLALFFCSCSVASYTPQIADFDEAAHIIIGESEFECRVVYRAGTVSVTANTSAAAGLSAEYDGETLRFTYGEMSYTLENEHTAAVNPAVFIYNIFYYIENAESLTADKTDSGYRFAGETALGSFVLYQNTDGTPRSIEMEAAGISVDFSENT